MKKDFHAGQQVFVTLTEKHELANDEKAIVHHPATIVGAHPSGDWYDVRLEEKHAGGTDILSVPAEVIVVEKKS